MLPRPIPPMPMQPAQEHAAAAAAAAEEEESVDPAVAQQALRLLLMHRSIHSIHSSLSIICTLLCVSKEVREAVCHFAAGAVPVGIGLLGCHTADEEQEIVIGLLEWLAKPHLAALASVIDVEFASYEAEDMFRRRAPEALLHAARAQLRSDPISASASSSSSSSSSLRLRRFAWGGETTAGPAMLTALAAAAVRSLTCLSWVLRPMRQEVAALAQLTGLRCMDLAARSERPISDMASDVLRALSSLCCLTQLFLLTVRPGQLAWLPPQLLELRLHRLMDAPAQGAAAAAAAAAAGDAGDVEFLQLAHLTQLTVLTENNPGYESSFAVSAGDQLPPRVRAMALAKLRGVTPLLQLQQLHQLSVDHVEAPALRQLHLFAGISSLQRARLVISDSPRSLAAAAGGPAWGQLLAVTDVTLHLLSASGASNVLPEPLATQLACLTCLTRLRLGGNSNLWLGNGQEELSEAAPGQLAELLRPLRCLQQLVLLSVRLQQPELRGYAAVPSSSINSVEELMGVLAGLPQLRRLRLSLSLGTQLYNPAAALLARATQLKELELDVTGLSNVSSELLEERLGAAGCSVYIDRA